MAGCGGEGEAASCGIVSYLAGWRERDVVGGFAPW